LEKIGFFRSASPAEESDAKRAETVAQAG